MKKKILITIIALTAATAAFSQATQTMYWIGGAGNWSDLTHWSYQSGSQGSTVPSSVPTAVTNVVVDANSGLTGTGTDAARTITVNVGGNIASFNATAGSNLRLIFNGSSANIFTDGNVTFQSNTTFGNFSFGSGSFNMQPAASTTTTLTTNGATLSGLPLGKLGAGTTNIVGNGVSGVYFIATAGTVNYNGTTWSSSNFFAINDGTTVNFPNLTTFTTTGSMTTGTIGGSGFLVGGTAASPQGTITLAASAVTVTMPNVTTFTVQGQVNTLFYTSNGVSLPLCTSFTGGQLNGAVTAATRIGDPSYLNMPACTNFSCNGLILESSVVMALPACTTFNILGGGVVTLSGATAVLSLPALRNMTATSILPPGASYTAAVAAGAIGSTINLPASGGASITVPSWTFAGTLNAGNSVFHIGDALASTFLTRAGTHIRRISFESTAVDGTLTGNGTYDTVTSVPSGRTLSMSSSMTIGLLQLAPSTINYIAAGQNVTITDNLTNATAACTRLWELSATGASSTSTAATLTNSTGHAINLQNVRVTKITAAGANAVTANPGINNGGNTNIVFTAPAARTLYWVGRGNDNEWNTPANWSTTSGGTVNPCVPTQVDNVVFDNNSTVGATLTSTGAPIYFHNINIQNNCPSNFTITTAPTSTYGIYCYGSWYMKSGIVISRTTGTGVSGVYFYSTSPNETITSNGSIFATNVYFASLGGWTLQDSLTLNSAANTSLYHRHGTLNTNGKKVNIARAFIGNESNATTMALPPGVTGADYRKLLLGSSIISVGNNVGSSSGNTWAFGAKLADTLNSGTSTIILNDTSQGTTFTAYSPITTNTTNAATTGGGNNPASATMVNNIGTLKYYNIVFNHKTGSGIIQIAASTYTSALYPFTAHSVRSTATTGVTVGFAPEYVALDSLAAGAYSTLRLPNASTTNSNIANGGRLTINQGMVMPTPDCTGRYATMTPYNTSAGLPSDTIYSAVNINIPNVQMTNIVGVATVTGRTFTASGINNGGNTNWTFTVPAPKDLYWIGAVGDGLWNTPGNWSINSNGTSSGNCVPTSQDNVHFNSFSFLPANKTINVNTIAANYKNFVAETGTPAGMIILRQASLPENCYGTLYQSGPGMIDSIVPSNNSDKYPLNLLAGGSCQLINGAGARMSTAIVVNNPNANWVFTNNMVMNASNNYSGSANLTITAATSVRFNNNFRVTNGSILLNSGTLTMNGDSVTLTGGAGNITMALNTSISAVGAVINASGIIGGITPVAGTGAPAASGVMNIQNAQITTGSWQYGGATLNAAGSSIKTTNPLSAFYAANGQQFNIVWLSNGPGGSGITTGTRPVTGNITITKLILDYGFILGNDGSSAVSASANTINVDTFIIRPTGAKVYIGATSGGGSSTLNVNKLMEISGSPCFQNSLRAGGPTTEGGITQTSLTATLNYLNADSVNKWDQITVGGILATGDTLKFGGNSIGLGLNNSKVIFEGVPGVDALPDNVSCVDSSNASARVISAANFFGTDVSTYKWYKKQTNDSLVQLNVPSTATSIDLRNFGLDGTYQVVIVYDSTAPVPCTASDSMFISFMPPRVVYGNGLTDSTWRYCISTPHTINDLRGIVGAASQSYETSPLYSALQIYSAATGGTQPANTTALQNNTTYYLTFLTTNGCSSPSRSAIRVVIDTLPIANAGPNQTGNPLNPFTMAGNTIPSTQSGLWTVVSGGPATITNPTSRTATVQLGTGVKNATMQWAVTNGTCRVTSTMTIGDFGIVPMINPGLRMRVGN